MREGWIISWVSRAGSLMAAKEGVSRVGRVEMGSNVQAGRVDGGF